MAVNSFSGLPAIPASYGFTAGKNKIINGDFRVNQRNFSSSTANDTFSADRWKCGYSSGTNTQSLQTFTPGTAPVAGYEGSTYWRVVTTGQTGTSGYYELLQAIEDVRTFAGQTVTISFWAKAASGTPSIALGLAQYFGTGGSPSAFNDTYGGKVTISTSWARYSVTMTVPSISGKTIGTNNDHYLQLEMWMSAGTDFNARTGSLGLQNNTFDVWGVQVEAGSTATAFQTATGTLAGELAACQRYYEKSYIDTVAPGTANDGFIINGFTQTSGQKCMMGWRWTVRKRNTPTVTIYDRAGNSGKLTTVDIGGTPTDNQTIALISSDYNGLNYLGGNNGTHTGYRFNWVADAEL